MICFNCGNDAGNEYQCPYCGASQSAYRMIVAASNRAYNEGLESARARDLSQAVESLNRSVRLDKYNTMARNLLGLVFFEMGLSAYALREWVLSKNLQPQDNPVDGYLAIVQSRGVLNRLDQTTQKYNQAIAYCRQGSTDLARIQLKRIINTNPGMVQAAQLLALVLINDGKYEEARKVLSQAARIDSHNPTIIRYMNSIRSELKDKKRRRRTRKNRRADTDFAAANELAAVPKTGILDIIDRNGNGFINILTGVGLGVLVAMFLIVPTMRQNENNRTSNALVSANKEAVSSANNIASLEKEVESLTKELDKYTGMGDLKTSYEKLLEADTAIKDGDQESAQAAIAVVNEKLLDAQGKAIYETVSHDIFENAAKQAYATGSAAFRARRYEDAITDLTTVVEFDPKYSDGYALYYLAQSYENTDDLDSAIPYYKQFAQLFPRTSRGRAAASKVEAYGDTVEPLESEADAAEDSTDTATGENNQ